MTSHTEELAERRTGSVAAGRLTTAAGIAMLVIAALHLITMSGHGLWPGWLAGDLRAAAPGDFGLGAFWAGIGGFAVPVAFLGFMIIRVAREGRRCGPWVGYGLLGWAAFCCFLLGPSGFLTFVVPALLLIMADLLGRLRHNGFHG
ncbi:hypothetical protein [Microlunatus parietis]|uniref:Uncharacterized protein n=1 Tax=Microlunatus parietis TaxID=682979 RepID=A0A7Y9I8V0_9ACTN|nr:hypothetical protein [Microlunatus parietis]NYE72342.1 hypothetical protein [Microlunatus parietis]